MNDKVYRFEFPFPAIVMHPNHASSRMAVARAKAGYKALIHALTLNQLSGEKPMLKYARMDTTWQFKQNRNRDRDNLLCWFKTGIDAITEAGMFENDSGVVHMPARIVIVKGESERVLVEIQECDPEFWK